GVSAASGGVGRVAGFGEIGDGVTRVRLGLVVSGGVRLGARVVGVHRVGAVVGVRDLAPDGREHENDREIPHQNVPASTSTPAAMASPPPTMAVMPPAFV